MLTEELHHRLTAAMKGGRGLEKSILRVALGEIQAQGIRRGRDLDDDEVAAVLRKLVKSDEESLAATDDAARRETLRAEIAILGALLPRSLDGPEIDAALEPVRGAIRGATAEGPAIGIAMAHLKEQGLAVDGRAVAERVRGLRG
ncbi:MAG: GatB/YqeY domain-containing protein [Planctomycetota bacterium]